MSNNQTFITRDGREFIARPFNGTDLRIAKDHLDATSRGGYGYDEIAEARRWYIHTALGVRKPETCQYLEPVTQGCEMKTNVSIELSNPDRNQLARLLDGKETKRLATRAEVVALCLQYIGGLVRHQVEADDPEQRPTKQEWDSNPLYTNNVKRSKKQ